MNCDSCIYYKEGICRKKPPVVIPIPVNPHYDTALAAKRLTVWPTVDPEIDWCGEFEDNN